MCPCCRDICNCSNHRNKKGWAPTKALHRSAKARGEVARARCLPTSMGLCLHGALPARLQELLPPYTFPDPCLHALGGHNRQRLLPACSAPSPASVTALSEGRAKSTASVWCPPAGYLSAAHYLVLTFASGLEAKRAALASGFCPEELAGGCCSRCMMKAALGGPLKLGLLGASVRGGGLGLAPWPIETAADPARSRMRRCWAEEHFLYGLRFTMCAAEKLEEEIAELEEEEARNPPPPPAPPSEPAAAPAAAEDQQQQGDKPKPKRKRKSAAAEGKGGAKGQAAAAPGEAAGELKTKEKRQRSSGGKKAAAGKEEAAAAVEGSQGTAGKKKSGKAGKKAAPSDAGEQAAAAGKQGEAKQAAAGGEKKKRQRKRKGQQAEAASAAAAAGVLETSGASPSGAVASGEGATAVGDAEVTAPAAKPSVVLKKAPFAFASRKRLPPSGAALLEAVAAAALI